MRRPRPRVNPVDATTTFESEVEAGRSLKQDGDEEGAIRHFQRLIARFPDDPLAHAELAYAYDFAGWEDEAVAPYRRALELGLPEDRLPGHLLGLGSTLRN